MVSNIKKPIIGIIPSGSWAEHEPGHTYFLRDVSIMNITDNQAVPMVLPFCPKEASEYTSMIDGLVITGGDDLPPTYYRESEVHMLAQPDITKRPEFSFEILKDIFKNKPGMPILGICGGMQIINVFFGGTLHQHVPDIYGTKVLHVADKTELAIKMRHKHQVNIVNTHSLFYDIVKTKSFEVNTIHHQAVKKEGKNIIITAIADDGVVEAIELKDYPFCLGVQWHPEFLDNTEVDSKIFKRFIQMAQKFIEHNASL